MNHEKLHKIQIYAQEDTHVLQNESKFNLLRNLSNNSPLSCERGHKNNIKSISNGNSISNIPLYWVKHKTKMSNLYRIFTKTLILLSLAPIQDVSGSPYVLTDERVRNIDVTPVLGRGYSIMTSAFLSTCINVQITTTPSYNYDYTFTDFTTSASEETQLTGSLTKSFAYDALKQEISESQESSVTTSKTQYVVSSMSIERFYASVREEISPIIPEGLALLERKDYVGFFMSCGSNYIRSIRRKQEVTGIFKFETTSVSTATAFASSLKTNIADEDGDGRQSSNSATSTKFDNVNSSLEIKILGYGLGLSQDGAGTLVANNLSEFNAVMDFAFRAMTQSGGGSMDIGMVYGVEVVPWVDNVQFQTNAKVTQENIEVPLARSLIPRAFNATNRFDFYNKNTDYNLRDQFRCKEAAHTIDMYGYCCEFASIYDNIEQIYEPSSPETKSCRPLQQLDGSMVKNNMASNAEFVIRLDQVLRLKLNNFALVEQCIGQISGIPSRTDNYILKQKAIAEYNSDLMAISVLEMKMVMDPFGDFGLLTHVGFEINEYIAMFYQRCITAMFGSGAPGETSAFLTAPWTGHSECMHLSCLGTLNRWSRDGAGCVPGILAGTGATEYKPDEEITQCVLDPDGTGDVEECLYKTHTLNQFQVRAKDCWNNLVPDGGVNAMYMIDNFCLPLVGQDKADEKYPDEYQQILGSVDYCGTIADIEDTSE